MSQSPKVAGIGVVDGDGVFGSSGVRTLWTDLGAEPLGTAGSFRKIFGRSDDTFRRLDRVSRAFVLATEAAGLSECMPEAARETTPIVVETQRGCLETDIRFIGSLKEGIVEGPVFPYTLPSTSLGEVAIRQRLRGPTICLSIGENGVGESLLEAERLLADDDVTFVLAASIEVLTRSSGGASELLRVVSVLLADSAEDVREVSQWSINPADFYDASVLAVDR